MQLGTRWWLIAAVFLTRGLLGIPVVLAAAQQHPYAQELRGRMTFMVVSSVICPGLGLCYAVGAGSLRQR